MIRWNKRSAPRIKGFRFHDLRHTFAARVRARINASMVRDLMGHSVVKTTNIYVNTTMDERRRAGEALCSAARLLPFVAHQAKVSP